MLPVQTRQIASPPCRILVIEDNKDGRDSLRMLLSLLGHRVDVAADGLEGVRKALEIHPDVIIVDIGLPKLSGYQVARLLRTALGPSVTLIAHTAYDRDDRLEVDFDTWLIKPVELSELLPWLKKKGREPD